MEEFNMNKNILDSWQRCHKLNLSKDEGYLKKYSKRIINNILNNNKKLINIATPFMENMVKKSIFMSALTDENAVVLNIVVEDDYKPYLESINFDVGISCSEKDIGTNGIGTALAIDLPMEVYGPNHYCKCHQEWTTIGVPIHDENMNIIGCIACCGPKDVFHIHTLGMAIASSEAIEDRIRLESAMDEINTHSKKLIDTINALSDGLISFNNRGEIEQINNAAKRLLGITDNYINNTNANQIFSMRILKNISKKSLAIYDEEMLLKTGNGKIKCFVTITPTIDEQKKISGFVTVIKESAYIHRLANRVTGAQALYTFDDIVGQELSFEKAINLAKTAALSSSNVLIQGGSGTGKELVAQAIHNDSRYKTGPFIAINCSAIPKDLLESELFGYDEGAFTGAIKGGKPGKFELANGGTILLDEIGDMPLNMQTSLLRVLQENKITRLGSARSIPINVRVIASTNKNIQDEVEKGTFRNDLYYRLNVINIILPPLKDRKNDIPLLVNYFILKKNKKLFKNINGMSKECLKILINYSWPGNVRELENLIERSVNICNKTTIGLSCLPQDFINVNNINDIDLNILTVEENEKKLIEKTLILFNGNITKTAKALKVNRSTIYRKLNRYKNLKTNNTVAKNNNIS